MAHLELRSRPRWWRNYSGLAGINDKAFGGLLNGSYPNDRAGASSAQANVRLGRTENHSARADVFGCSPKQHFANQLLWKKPAIDRAAAMCADPLKRKS